eukprot:scaffold73590_cov31-Tisochrysis_lutea.AAC.1
MAMARVHSTSGSPDSTRVTRRIGARGIAARVPRAARAVGTLRRVLQRDPRRAAARHPPPPAAAWAWRLAGRERRCAERRRAERRRAERRRAERRRAERRGGGGGRGHGQADARAWQHE